MTALLWFCILLAVVLILLQETELLDLKAKLRVSKAAECDHCEHCGACATAHRCPPQSPRQLDELAFHFSARDFERVPRDVRQWLINRRHHGFKV